CPHTFDGTHFTRWKNWMICNFKFISAQMWWIVDVGFSHAIDRNNATQAQEKCLHLNCQATNILYKSMKDNIFVYLNKKYGTISDDDDDEPKEAHEDVEHIHNTVIVEDCSTSWSSDSDDDVMSLHCFTSHGDAKVSIGNVVIDFDDPNFELVRRLIKALRNEMAKTKKLENENSFLKTTCEQQKHLLYVTTCSHEKLKLAHEELSVAHDNLVQDHAFLTNKLSNEEIKTSESSSLGSNDQSHNVANPCDIEKKHHNTKVTIEYIMKNQRSYGDMSGIGFNKCKGKNMKMQEEKISHFMCYWCHGMGHLAKYCPTKKTQVEPKAKPQVQVKINHQDGDLGRKKRKTRRGGRTRHPMLIQDAKMMSKNQDEKKDYAHIKCYACEDMGHFASKCSTKLEKKIQEKLKRQGNEEQHMSKKEKARSKRVCYSCRERGHMANSCPLGNNSKPISIIDNNVLRKDGNVDRPDLPDRPRVRVGPSAT
ncbi:hypothetical protein SETIT_9G276500v2, partial [Setaria italica]